MAPKTEVDLHIYVNRNGRRFLAPSNIGVLREIRSGGSLRTAAKTLNISYQHIWDVVDEINRRSSHPVVIKQRGGAGGGGAALSEYGKQLLGEYQAIENEVRRFVRRLNTEINL